MVQICSSVAYLEDTLWNDEMRKKKKRGEWGEG